MRHAGCAPAESSAAVVKVFMLPSLLMPLQGFFVSPPLRLNVASFTLFNNRFGSEGVEIPQDYKDGEAAKAARRSAPLGGGRIRFLTAQGC